MQWGSADSNSVWLREVCACAVEQSARKNIRWDSMARMDLCSGHHRRGGCTEQRASWRSLLLRRERRLNAQTSLKINYIIIIFKNLKTFMCQKVAVKFSLSSDLRSQSLSI